MNRRKRSLALAADSQEVETWIQWNSAETLL